MSLLRLDFNSSNLSFGSQRKTDKTGQLAYRGELNERIFLKGLSGQPLWNSYRWGQLCLQTPPISTVFLDL